ncbi:HNH endonuclease signature motif containing protein [Massilia sp. Root418]|uniref:HNH endonuclease n=1 Tax=Massilia sp. Root418 TaxID=1736532 RepID=UPI000AB2B7EC|nr:HNH endonuclease signature motif containing protein [Massilia sp. Root418]
MIVATHHLYLIDFFFLGDQLIHPFIRGREYIRSHLLEFIGSKQAQSGVLWGSKEPGCLICTSGGRHGKKAGYSDELVSDGTWWYFGQGQAGDQDVKNSANAKLASEERSVLLFTSREPTSKELAAGSGYGKRFAFQGCFNVSGHEFITPTSGPRANDRLVRFRLVPADGDADFEGAGTADFSTEALLVMRKELTDQNHSPTKMTALREYRKRSDKVHIYALTRAKEVCEGCHSPAPFFGINGRGFLEVHHMTRLADDGPDAPSNVAALCPNCHRRAHCSQDRVSFNQAVQDFVANLESSMESHPAATSSYGEKSKG